MDHKQIASWPLKRLIFTTTCVAKPQRFFPSTSSVYNRNKSRTSSTSYFSECVLNVFDKKCFLIFSMPLHHSFPSKSTKSLQFFLDVSNVFHSFPFSHLLFPQFLNCFRSFPMFSQRFPQFFGPRNGAGAGCVVPALQHRLGKFLHVAALAEDHQPRDAVSHDLATGNFMS